jgi:GNAT superfamily N-acetyltransferase
MMDGCIRIEPAAPEDLPLLPGIEARAARIFASEDLPAQLASQTRPQAELERAAHAGQLLVARPPDGPVVGFLLLAVDGRDAVIEEVDVDPESARQGIGRRLIEAACDWARAGGFARIVLSTFRAVPWNAPFYARLGFREIPSSEWTALERAMRADEEAMGLDLSKRLVMARSLGS